MFSPVSGNPQKLNLWVTPTKMANDALGAQAYFSTIQQLFSSSSDMKKQTCCISNKKYFILEMMQLLSNGASNLAWNKTFMNQRNCIMRKVSYHYCAPQQWEQT